MLPSMTLPSCNDVVLLVTLFYSALDIRSEWATFSTCRKPVHQWLLASYALIIIFRILHTVGNNSAQAQTESSAGEFLMNLRLKGKLPQFLLYVTWFIVMPGFAIWTVAGTLWTWEVWSYTSQCLPPQFMWFSLLWQLVSYLWIAAHFAIGFVALSRERRLRMAEADLRALEDPDTLLRWGAVSELQSEGLLREPRGGQGERPGLSPAEISALGGIWQQETPSSCSLQNQDCEECPICLLDIQPGDSLRRLPSCTHSFHRSCIDLWLLQSATCPLCKVDVPRCCPKPSAANACTVEGSFFV